MVQFSAKSITTGGTGYWRRGWVGEGGGVGGEVVGTMGSQGWRGRGRGLGWGGVELGWEWERERQRACEHWWFYL